MHRISFVIAALGVLIESAWKVDASEVCAAEREGRAVWTHSGAFPGDWKKSLKLLSESGFNMVLPNVFSGGVAHYASEVLPRSELFRKYGDQIEQCCAAAPKYGVEVHVWKINFYLFETPQDFLERMRHEGRTQVTVDGKPFNWLCPSHPENRKLERESMLEVVRKYPIDGLHFDYIRYPKDDLCYCAGCRQRFEADSGQRVSDWPQECYAGFRKEEYNNWRCRQITTLVKTISHEARILRPEIKISAAVFASHPACRKHQAQDWPEWIKAGYLDFVCPMNYTHDEKRFADLVRNQVELVGGRIPLYPGIGALSSMSRLTAEGVLKQIEIARSLGASGFVIFNFNAETAEAIIPKLSLGGSQTPLPAHRQ